MLNRRQVWGRAGVPGRGDRRALARADPDGIRLRPARRCRSSGRVLTPGAVVAIAGGPLRGFEGIYSGQSAQEREIVLLNLLGAVRPVEIAAGLLAPH